MVAGGPAAAPRFVALIRSALLVLALWQLGTAAWLPAKAWLAQQLLSRAWAATVQGAQELRPWPWADLWPVARLRWEPGEVDQIILSNTSGRTLAFGPGHLRGTPAPGRLGATIFSGHRDTHFRFLRELHAGNFLQVQTADGRWRRYQVTGTAVVDTRRRVRVLPCDGPCLVLVTCYPFDAIATGGPLRYAVSLVSL